MLAACATSLPKSGIGSSSHFDEKFGQSGVNNLADIHKVTQRFGCFAGPSKKSMF